MVRRFRIPDRNSMIFELYIMVLGDHIQYINLNTLYYACSEAFIIILYIYYYDMIKFIVAQDFRCEWRSSLQMGSYCVKKIGAKEPVRWLSNIIDPVINIIHYNIFFSFIQMASPKQFVCKEIISM